MAENCRIDEEGGKGEHLLKPRSVTDCNSALYDYCRISVLHPLYVATYLSPQ